MSNFNMTAISQYFISLQKKGIFTKKYLTKSCKNAKFIRNTRDFIPNTF